MIRLKSNRTRMSPAAHAAGLSAYRCQYCKKHLTLKEEAAILKSYVDNCAHCLRTIWAEDVEVCIRRDYQFALNADLVGRREWYHATNHKNWVEELSRSEVESGAAPYVHVGSMESACALADQKHSAGAVWYINKLKIKPESKIAGKVFDDDNWWPEDSNDLEGFEGFGSITRYVNRYEVPGSISLLLDYRVLEVVESRRLTRAEVRATLAR